MLILIINRKHRDKCSWSGYRDIGDGLEDWLEVPCHEPGEFIDNLDFCIYTYNKESFHDDAFERYLTSHGLIVLDKYKKIYNIMEIKIDRKWKKSSYTISNLYVDGIKLCNCLEDTDRGLTSSMALSEIKKIKVKTATAIPSGRYQITINIVSPKYSKKSTFVQYCGAKMPRLLNVPGFDGVLIHPGNTNKDTDGCLLPGKNDQVGKVTNSTYWWKLLYSKMKEAKSKGESIWITIE